MIRKLKFRGFSIKGEVVFGDFLTPWADDQHYPIIRDTADYKDGIAHCYYHDVREGSVHQLIAIDKNGNEVYECDSVIRILELNDDGELVHVEAFPMQATFDDFSAINNGEIILVEPYRYDSQNKTA